ncbi:MAG TPA: sigma-70 family RNA polymerase sigma factor, partial [Tepidisphaeraceae bacterium]|nr:sigma-70 family RNA polymerase sigma factor [Tepidisphaeraceae bacterium]
MGATDAELLNEYARSKSDAAFAALAARYGPLVYAAALRQVRRADLADDVTQAVWIVLVQRTPLAAGSHLAGWLLTTTRYCAKDALRKQARRAHHEHEAAAMKPLVSPPPDATAADDDHLAKHLDEALSRLRPQASAAVALRFLQDQPLADVARATGMTVDAAQKVVARALPQLRRWLTQRGVLLSSTAVLTDAMLRLPRAGNIAAPISPAAASPNSIAIAKGAIHMMRLTVVKTASLATAAAFLLTAAGAGVVMMNSATAAAPPKPA